MSLSPDSIVGSASHLFHAMSLSLDTPLSLYSIPIVWATAFYPHNKKLRLIRNTVGYDNINPRSNDAETLSRKGMPLHTIQKIGRMNGAYQNGMEVFPVWAVAVLAANYAGVEQRTLNIVSGAFILFRILFNYIYVNQTSWIVSVLRVTWIIAMIFPTYLLIKAGNNVRVRS